MEMNTHDKMIFKWFLSQYVCMYVRSEINAGT
jgi:hypothetical protein